MSLITASITTPTVSSATTSSGTSATPTPLAAPNKSSTTGPESAPGTTVTLSDQARNALAGTANMSASADGAEPFTYESMKRGVASAVGEIEDAASDGFHSVVRGLETVASSANSLLRGVLESPFVAVSKVCDAVGSVIDEL
jgi:hypothetical protein